ncbi:MAG: CHAT domain-containing protein, partial [Bacteroidota bacterium]
QNFQSEMAVFVQNAHSVYQSILAPLLAELPNSFFSSKVDKLTIIPDDFLFTLPFEVLVQNKSNSNVQYGDLDYLLSTYDIDYQFSAFMLNQESKVEQEQLAFFGFAPEFGSQAIVENRSCIRDELYSLRCSQSETENINAFFNGQVLLAEQANTDAFWTAIEEADILHLATHVCLDAEDQLNTRVFLSDGYITALDLTGKQFSNELTVLSACDTGAGKLVKGEGVASIAREFMMAGSKSTLTSLWSVDDCSTSKIMELYYQQLHQGQEKPIALKQAKQEFLKTADVERAHPYYWAAFLQFGDAQAIFPAAFDGGMLLYLGLLGILVLGILFLVRRKQTSV